MAAGAALPSAFEGAVAAMPTPQAAGGSNKVSEAQEALFVLGYSRTEVLTALSGIDTANLDTENIIRAALKKLM
jgi:Holliday junction resolvasome RuvABC DNA-binding subunit